MKKFIVIFLLTLSVNVSAQRIDKPNEPYFVYCYLTLSMQNEAQLTIGEDGDYYIIADEDGKKINFPSKVNFFTYLGKRGWEYVECLNVGDWRFIFRKKVLHDYEAFSGLKLIYKTGKDKGKIREETKE